MQDLPSHKSVLPVQAQVMETSPDGRPLTGHLGVADCSICQVVQSLMWGWKLALWAQIGMIQLPVPPVVPLAGTEAEPGSADLIVWLKCLVS